MKKLISNAAYKFLLLFVFSATQLVAFTQDAVSHTSTTVTTKTNNFQIEPWMWIAGGAVVLIILVALLRGNTSKETTVITSDRL